MRILGLLVVLLALLACRQIGTPEEELINRTAEILNTKNCNKLYASRNSDRAYTCKVTDEDGKILKNVEMSVYDDVSVANMDYNASNHACKSLKACKANSFSIPKPPTFICTINLEDKEVEDLKKSLSSI